MIELCLPNSGSRASSGLLEGMLCQVVAREMVLCQLVRT